MKNKPTRYKLKFVSLKLAVSEATPSESCLRAGVNGVREHFVGCCGICAEESGERTHHPTYRVVSRVLNFDK